MTRQEFKNWNQKAEQGEVNDNMNPAFILGMTMTQMLAKIAQGEINMVELAKRELENRGCDINGQWAGFKHEIK